MQNIQKGTCPARGSHRRNKDARMEPEEWTHTARPRIRARIAPDCLPQVECCRARIRVHSFVPNFVQSHALPFYSIFFPLPTRHYQRYFFRMLSLVLWSSFRYFFCVQRTTISHQPRPRPTFVLSSPVRCGIISLAFAFNEQSLAGGEVVQRRGDTEN